MESRERLLQALRVRPHIASAQLLAALGVSRATLMRSVRAAAPEILTIGRGRRTRYAARRSLRGNANPLPVFQVDEQGDSEQIAALNLAHPEGTFVELNGPSVWPLDEPMRDGWFDGLPYFLQDLRPDGYLGHRFARTHARMLQLSDDPRQWSDDDVLHALSLLGADQSGNLIVGESAYRLWLEQAQQAAACLRESEISDAYVEHAQRAMLDGYAGSSAAGEFPKFTAVRLRDGQPAHVLVKFSGSDDSAGTQRWSDLLVCEHLAAQTLASVPGLTASQTRVLQAGNRTFLEGVRFDRHGGRGRSALCSWAAFNHAWFGLSRRSWTEGAARLLERGLIDDDTAQGVARLWHFGRLIANTDMHDHNLSYRPQVRDGVPSLTLAPVYDMLPMAYAPHRGVELAPVNFVPQLPLPAERGTWQDAAAAAARFWSQAADDPRISAAFRAICADNLRAVRKAAALPAVLPRGRPGQVG